MQKRIIVNGAPGKMGRAAMEALGSHPEFEIVAALHRGDNLAVAIEDKQADIVLDLTSAEAVYANTRTIIEKAAHPVIGTSGLNEQQIRELSSLCDKKKLGGIIVPNFSLGAVLMMHFSRLAAAFMPEVEIIEAHHQDKLDAPSGTALKTAELIVKARKAPKKSLNLKEILPGARGGLYEDINIHSLRLPGILARQQVIFGNTGETLSISHDTLDRKSFMPGIILACQKVGSLDRLYYGLEHLLGLS